MDHLLEHEGEAIPTSGGGPDLGASSTGAAPMDMDEDEEATATALGITGEGAEAKVRTRVVHILSVDCSSPSVSGQSIKCSICNKTFRNTALANFHAEKSGHDQFEESAEEVRRVILFLSLLTSTRPRTRQQIKPLTEEETREKLAELREKMASKRAAKAEMDVKEAKENEKIRRKQGNVGQPLTSIPRSDSV